MKKSIKTLLIIMFIIIFCIGIDITSIYTRNKPIFAISKNDDSVNQVYRGILYDTYNCFTESMVHIKPKWSKYTCSEIKNKNMYIGKITQINDKYIVITGVSDENNLSYEDVAHVILSNNPKVIGANNLIIGQIIKLEAASIQEVYPILITTKKIEVIALNDNFEIIDETEVCAQALEEIYETEFNKYYLPCIKSSQVFIKFANGNKYSIKEALNNGYVTAEQIINKGFNIIVNPKIKVSIELSNAKELTKAKELDEYAIYYYGLNKATISVGSVEYDFADAIYKDVIKADEVISNLEVSSILRDGGTTIYKDGGTSKYNFDEFTIIKCNKIINTGIYNKDIYIGPKDMDYEENFCK